MSNSAALGFLKEFSLGFLLVATAINAAGGQENRPRLVRLFQLDGTFGTEVPAKVNSHDKTETRGFTLIAARLENDNLGFLSRLRSVLTVANRDAKRTITGVEWRLDIYDRDLRSLSQSVVQTDKVNIYAGETAAASARFGAVLPDRMIVLLQITKVSFAEGSAWLASEECSLEDDLRAVSCKSR